MNSEVSVADTTAATTDDRSSDDGMIDKDGDGIINDVENAGEDIIDGVGDAVEDVIDGSDGTSTTADTKTTETQTSASRSRR